MVEQSYFFKRSFFYGAMIYTGKLFSGDNYDKLRPVTCINLIDFPISMERRIHSIYKFIGTNGDERDEMELHFIDISSEYMIEKGEKVCKNMAEWIRYLRHRSSDMDVIAKYGIENEDIFELDDAFKRLCQDPAFMAEYITRLKLDHDTAQRLSDSRKAGLQEGRLEGILQGKAEGRLEGILEGRQEGALEKQRENALNFLKLGIAPDVVAKGIGLSLEEVEKIKKECK